MRAAADGIWRRLVTTARKIALTSPRTVRRAVGEDFLDALEPEFLWLEATDSCGSRCAFCDIWKKPSTRHPLSPSEIEAVLRDPIFRRLRVVIVSGGEPTVRKDLEQILAAVHRAVPTAYIVLSSSAMLPDRLLAVVRATLDQGIDLEVGVSLDGIGPRHDQARGIPGLFEKVDRTLRELAGMKRLHPRRLSAKVGFVVSDLTADQLEAVRDYATGLGLEFNPQWYNQGAYYGNVGRDLLSDTVRLERLTRTLRPTPLNTLARGVLAGKPLDYRCATLHNSCLLKSNGDVVPCFRHWDEKAGNVREDAPSAIWKSEAARRTRRLVRECHGCLNSCGVLWSTDANLVGRMGFQLRHPTLLLEKLGWRARA
jgi:MoaA/NifB/PqqE/SkfB family radical SAM enzyme